MFNAVFMAEIGDLCETRGEIEVQWRIKDYSSLHQQLDIRYESPNFYFSGASWSIWLYPYGETKFESNGWLSLYVVRKSCESSATLDYSLGLKRTNGENDFFLTRTQEFGVNDIGWGRKIVLKTVLMEKKSQLLPSDTLTVVCSLKNSNAKDIAETYFSRLQDVSVNLKEIYQKGKKTDFTLKVGDENIRAHRVILETRSPVFAAMLNHDTRENQTGEVSVEDLDKSAVDSILCYIYSGDIDNLTTKNALSLYAAAEKYDIKNVKGVCVKFIQHNLSAEWVCDVIKFADLYNEEDLGRHAREYFTKNADKILDSDKWKSFIRENALMGVELLSSIVKYSLPKTTTDK